MMSRPGHRLSLASLIIATLLLTACGPRYPLGIPEEQWTSMSLAEQNQARIKQAELDQAQAEARRREAAAREAEAAARAAELEHARATAAPGERVQCILRSLEMYHGGKWRAAEPVGLDLVAGMPVRFDLEARDGYRTGSGTAHFNGVEVRLCRVNRERDCARFLATSGELRRGVTQSVWAERFLRGRMHCELAVTDNRLYRERRLYP